jgi:hypothetical protein
MVRRFLVLIVLVWATGCGSQQPPVASDPQGRDALNVPPAQMRTILEGLRSDQPRVQYAALLTLDQFPKVVQAHRAHLERLQRAGGDQRVRQKAAELLTSGTR